MATSSIDKNKKAESSTRAREQAKAQEAELKKKHADEVKRLQSTHGEKVRELQKTHEKQLETVRTRGQSALSEKDKKYQDEIDKVKNTQTQQARNSAQNFDRKIRQIQDSHESELNKTNEIHDSQLESLSSTYERDTKKKEENFTKAVEEMRSGQAEALGDQRERLEEAHSKNSNSMRDTQDKKINTLTNDLQSTREQKNSEIKNLKVESLSDRQESEADKLNILTQERKTQEMHKENMRNQYAKNLDEIKEKYGRYNNETRNGRAQELNNMQSMAEEKNKEQVGALERRIRAMNSEHDNERFIDQKTHSEEKKAYLNANKEALQKAELERSMVYGAANEKTSSEIKSVVNRHADLLDRQGKYYQGRIGEMELKYDESVENQVKSLVIENKTDKQKAADRQAKLQHILGKEKNDLESYYKEVIDHNDRAHKDEMAEQRLSLLKEKNEVVSRLEARMREIDAKNTEKTNQLIIKYERDIGNIKDEHKADKKRVVDQYSKRMDELEKNHKFQLESERMSSKSREDQLKSKFERNISQMEIKQDEERIRMATVLKK